jgi:hypothetical protein
MRLAAASAIVTLVACHHAAEHPDAAPGDAHRDGFAGVPDLTLVAAEMDGTVRITTDVFDPAACELVEACIGAPGPRRLLRFDTVTANIGTGDLFLGAVPPMGESAGVFTWSPCHMHHHVIGYAEYELRDASGIVQTGHKEGFCLEDNQQITPGRQPQYSCGFQGITPGWADVYGSALPCQWIDITSTPPGTYTLRVVIDRTGVLPDSNPDDNEWTTTVSF